MKLTIDIPEFLVDTFGMSEAEIGQKVLQMINEVRKSKAVVKGNLTPTLVDVTRFFLEKGRDEILARQFFEYYDAAEWKDSRGKKVVSWKQKALGVWINKPQNNSYGSSKPANIDKYKSAAERDSSWVNDLDQTLGFR